MRFIKLTLENLEEEHICCCIGKTEEHQARCKKEWLADRMKEGLVFLKANVRGKCFIEYMPAEQAWTPIEAEGYMHIDCLWVSGKYKGQGLSNRLLDECIKDSREKGKQGLTILTSARKRGFLADSKHLNHKGFRLADTAEPYFQLFYLPFSEDAPTPCFRRKAAEETREDRGFVLYYSKQCPFTVKYVPVLEAYAVEKQIPFRSILLESGKEAQAMAVPFTAFALFYDGEFVTHEILSLKKFQAAVERLAGEKEDL